MDLQQLGEFSEHDEKFLQVRFKEYQQIKEQDEVPDESDITDNDSYAETPPL